MTRLSLVEAESASSDKRQAVPGAADETPRAQVRRTVILAVLFAFPACLAVTSLAFGQNNPDLWWHLRTGAWIIQHHSVPWTDPYSSFGMGKPWFAYSWLYELILYGFYRWLGLVGPAVLVVLLAGVNGAVLYRAVRSRVGTFAAAIGLTAVGTLVLASFYTAMPVLISILCFIIEIDILFGELVGASGRFSSRRRWLLPLLFSFWANVHVEFIYGLAVLVFAAVAQASYLANHNRVPVASTSRGEGRRLWTVTVASIVATLLNPYGWRLYGVIWGLAKDRTPFKVVTELNAPTFRSPLDYILVLTMVAAGFFLGRTRFRGNLFAGTLLAGCAVVSLHAAHDTWAALIVALLIIAEGSSSGQRSSTIIRPRLELLGAALALFLVVGWARREDLSNHRLEVNASKDFPVRAAQVVLQRRLPGPLFNGFNWGGYLIWKLPNLPVAMDGRTNVYGGVRTERNIATWTCQPGWRDDPDLNAAKLVIGGLKAPLSYALRSDPEFQLVYEDETSAVFVRNSQQTGAVTKNNKPREGSVYTR